MDHVEALSWLYHINLLIFLFLLSEMDFTFSASLIFVLSLRLLNNLHINIFIKLKLIIVLKVFLEICIHFLLLFIKFGNILIFRLRLKFLLAIFRWIRDSYILAAIYLPFYKIGTSLLTLNILLDFFLEHW